ncbi:MAG TPA: AMP-binding protein, partial [Bryobacteraceae bacterium]|nr:AMP-binding protein [Bryobacteraceae bacterium]
MTTDLFEQLERHAASRPGDIALQTLAGGASENVTFRDLIDRSRALSRAIGNAGVGPGGRVALLLANNHQFGVAFFAAASAGAVIVPLDPSYDADRLCAVITHAECSLLIHAGHFPELASAIRDRLPDLEILDAPAAPVTSDLPPWPLAPRDPDDDFLLMYTGGTTGAPKGVRLTLRGVVVTIRDTLAVFPLDPGDHVLSILPLFHIMALQANLLGPLYA